MPSSVFISEEACRQILRMARQAIEHWLDTGNLSLDPVCPHPDLNKAGGLFVTLRKKGDLRGCVGQMTSDEPLFRLVQELAVASASRDFRFPALDQSEWPGIRIEISVLSPLTRILSPNDMEIGRHGIVVKKDGRTGVYLPEVAPEAGWSKEEFFRRCAKDKAGLSEDEIEGAEIYVFSSQKISE
ncbi:MAG: AmmeMemoRadiSam system protein A [Candidatus Omnitrophica bacterium]|nr:AmmeMemoRadiSam system protein A [Candidatus Omnitrophota bacterium]